jgi:hypothetical protein
MRNCEIVRREKWREGETIIRLAGRKEDRKGLRKAEERPKVGEKPIIEKESQKRQ